MKRTLFLFLVLFGLNITFSSSLHAQEQPSQSDSGGDEKKEHNAPKMNSNASGGDGGREDLIRGDKKRPKYNKRKEARKQRREERKQRRKFEKLRKKQTNSTTSRMIDSEKRSSKINGHNEMPFYKRWFKHTKEAMAPANNNATKTGFRRFWYGLTHPGSNKRAHSQKKGEFKSH